ncbi:MAG: hypothetical protein M3308_06605 [Actinomycetota bacterium]|nr:hypothetical protein [Actinomycetota bacterium]
MVQRLRMGVLGGRGPGADEAELFAHQRGRELLGALPCATERAIVALQTRAARGDMTPAEVRVEVDRIRRTLS